MSKRLRDNEELKRRKLVRLRFRNLVRSVALNRIWLVDYEDKKLSLNVKRNIAMLLRPQRKIGLLTLAEKTLIRMHPTLRSVTERKALTTLMANFTCFSNLPPKTRARMAQCVQFMIVTSGRKLIKQGNEPLMVYFLLTGEVTVSKDIFDNASNSWVQRIEMISGPGDCLGEVEVIEKCNRLHTCTTSNDVELLVVYVEDFIRVLLPVMEKQWNDKKSALLALDYFALLTTDQIITACKLCALQQFEPLETIYSEDKGQLSSVYFVLSGECMILQCLEMMVTVKGGEKKFQLIDLSTETSDNMFKGLPNTKSDEIQACENENKSYLSRRIENHFIDVGSLSFGGMFGLGERLQHRVIMARTVVQCLMLPRYWLFEKPQNPGNIWQRRRFYLDTTIPSRDTLFMDFITTRHWRNFKNSVVQSRLNPDSIANTTKEQDIPIICRLVEVKEN